MVIVSQHNITMCRLHHVHHHNATMQTNWLRLVWTLKYYLYVSITAIKTNYRSVYSINIAHSVSDAAACHAMPNDAQNMHIFVVLFVFELIWRLVWDDNHLPTCWSLSVICERARARSRRGIRSNWIWKQEKQFESTSDECVCLTFYWAFFSVSMAILSMHALQYVCTDLDLTDGDISSRQARASATPQRSVLFRDRDHNWQNNKNNNASDSCGHFSFIQPIAGARSPSSKSLKISSG